MKKRILIGMVIIFAMSLCACSKSKNVSNSDVNHEENVEDYNTEPDKEEPERCELHIAAMNTLDILPLQIMIQQGFDEEHGFDLNIDLCATKEEQRELVKNNKEEGILFDVVELCKYRQEGVDLKALGENSSEYRLIAGRHSSIDVIDNAKEAKVAIIRQSLDEYLLDAMLAQANYRDDFVSKVDIQSYDEGVSGLKNGEYELALLKEPYATQAILDGGIEIENSNDQYESMFMLAFDGNMYLENKEIVPAFLSAYKKAVDYIATLKKEEVREVLMSIEGFTPDVLDKGVGLCFAELSLPMDEELEGVVGWSVSRGICNKAYLREELVYEPKE